MNLIEIFMCDVFMFVEQKLEHGVLSEQCQRLQRSNSELHRTAESFSRKVAVSKILYLNSLFVIKY